MTKAAFYVYRNLTRKTFSVKHGGRVIEHADRILILSGNFKVNENGRQRVIREQKKYVHAFITTTDGYIRDREGAIENSIEYWDLNSRQKREVSYNPFKNETFIFRDSGEPVEGSYPILIENNKVFVFTY